MGRLRLFYLAVLLTGALVEVEGQEGFLDKIKNFFQTHADESKMKIEEFKEAIGDKFDSFSEKIKNFFNERDFSSAKAAELMDELKGDEWNDLEPAVLMSMAKGEAQKLISKDDIPKRFRDELKRLLVRNATNAETAALIRDLLPILNAGEISGLLQRLGPLKTWNKANISSFGAYTLRIPVCFDDADDKEVLQGVLDQVKICDTSNPPRGCPDRSLLDDMRVPLLMKMSGAPKSWKMSEVEDLMPTYSDIPSFAIRHTSDSFVKDMKAKLKTVENLPTATNEDVEAWMMEICRVDDCRGMSAADAKTWYNGLGSLKTAVMPSHMSQEAREDAELSAKLEVNAKSKIPVPPMDAAILLDMKLDKAQPESIDDIGGKLAVWGPACYLMEAAEKKTLNSVRRDVSSRLEFQRGPEHMAKVNAAFKANMEEALSGNGFRISVVDNYLRPFVSPDYLDEQSSSSILGVAKQADVYNIQPNPFQLHIMAKLISTLDSQEAPPILKERLPISSMATVSTSVLARLDERMLGTTLPCLLGAKKVFGDKTSLEPKDITNGKAFLKCMSYDDAMKVKTSEIFEVFDSIKNDELSWPACRAFGQKVTEWAKNNLNIGDSENLEDIVDKLYLDEIYNMPACVFIFFVNVIYKADMQVKKAVLDNLCNGQNYISIPRDVRRRAVNTLLPQIMEEPITPCDMANINVCFIDLDPAVIRKMDEGSTAIYLQILEQLLNVGYPLCLDSDQRDEVAEMVLEYKGPAANWKTATDVSCILDTISSRGMERIAADMPAEVLITTECPKRDPTFFSTPLQGECMREVEEARMRMKTKKVEKCVKLRERFGTNNSTCDSVMCGNVLRMTSSQLERMDKQEVVRLLEGLATEDLDMNKAKVVLSKVKEVKPLRDMSAAELGRVKYAWRGLSKQDVTDLPALTSDHKDVIFHLGMTTGLPDDVMIALRDKILDDYKQLSGMDETDVFLLGGLACYLSEDQVNAIPNEVFMKSMRNLGALECKNATTTHYLAMKAKAAYDKKPDEWDAAMVYESGNLMAGMKPEDLANIPASSFIGFTASGLSRIDTEAIKVMTEAQAKNLEANTAAAMTSSQMRVLSDDVRRAISNAKSAEQQNGASGVFVSQGMVAMTTVLLFFFFFFFF